MARFASVALLIFLATLIGHVFTLPVVKRDVKQLEQDLELFNGDIDGLSQAINQYTDPQPDAPRPTPVSDYITVESVVADISSAFYPLGFRSTSLRV